jgi:hypothetical protein
MNQIVTHILADPHSRDSSGAQRSQMLNRKSAHGTDPCCADRARAALLSFLVRACSLNVQYRRWSDISSAMESKVLLTLVGRTTLLLLLYLTTVFVRVAASFGTVLQVVGKGFEEVLGSLLPLGLCLEALLDRSLGPDLMLVLPLQLGQSWIFGTLIELQVDILVRFTIAHLKDLTIVVADSVLGVVFGSFGGTRSCAGRAFGLCEFVDGTLSGHDHFLGVVHCTFDGVHDDEEDVRGFVVLSASLLDPLMAAGRYILVVVGFGLATLTVVPIPFPCD